MTNNNPETKIKTGLKVNTVVGLVLVGAIALAAGIAVYLGSQNIASIPSQTGQPCQCVKTFDCSAFKTKAECTGTGTPVAVPWAGCCEWKIISPPSVAPVSACVNKYNCGDYNKTTNCPSKCCKCQTAVTLQGNCTGGGVQYGSTCSSVTTQKDCQQLIDYGYPCTWTEQATK